MNEREGLPSLIDELTELRAEMLREEGALEDRLGEICGQHRASARNLAHYLALRRHHIRDLQEKLIANGLSSLGACCCFSAFCCAVTSDLSLSISAELACVCAITDVHPRTRTQSTVVKTTVLINTSHEKMRDSDGVAGMR
jgi:hypothetical protein